ncbi:MAG: hypothetical protein GYB67_18160, partial [Chloroflexi bacterium]|nr:hypothetical protein [Chloroflexota bacterium]
FCPGYIYENLELHHGKFFTELGELAPWFERNSFRYANAELDAILDQMQVLDPADQATEIDLYRQAVEILVEDVPTTGLVNRPAVVPINETFWTNWPSQENPWNAPWSWWATFNLVINGYPDPETGEWVGGIQPAGE